MNDLKYLRAAIADFRRGEWDKRAPSEMADALHDLFDRVADILERITDTEI